MSNFKKGLLLGGLLGVAMTWLNKTKVGRVVRDQVEKQIGNVVKGVEKKVRASDQWKKWQKK